MADQKEIFVRRSAPFSFGNALYTSKDYMLLVDRSATAERYRRLYFKDIQSIQVLQTRRSNWIMFFTGLPGIGLGILAALLVLGDDDGVGFGVGISVGLLAAVFLFLFAVNLLKGRTCRVYVSTAVQRVILPSVERVRRARRLVEDLETMIFDAQGKMTSEELNTELTKGWERIRARGRKKGDVNLRPKQETAVKAGPAEPDYDSAADEQSTPEETDTAEMDSVTEPEDDGSREISLMNDNSELEGERDVPVS